MNTKFTPETDGITHINMYSNAKTPFGQMLSDFYHFPMETEDGHFESVEGLWYFLSLPDVPAMKYEREQMRKFYGAYAKRKGREFRNLCANRGIKLNFDTQFERKILAAAKIKIEANKHLWKNEYKGLPIVHYYAYDWNGKRIIKDVTNDFPWLINGINDIVSKMFA